LQIAGCRLPVAEEAEEADAILSLRAFLPNRQSATVNRESPPQRRG
jgi:hypothetical protein